MNPSTFFNGLYKKPFKIFVTARGNAIPDDSNRSGKSSIALGTDTRAAYEEVLSSIPENDKQNLSKESEDKPTRLAIPLKKFDKNRFLKSCQENDVEALSEMDLSLGSNLNILDDFGWNGLMIAACSNAIDAFSFLLSKDVDFEHSDRSGRSALQLAEMKGNHQILEVFREYVRSRREEPRDDANGNRTEMESFHCDVCDLHLAETSKESHSTSVLHRFHCSSQLPGSSNRANYGIPTKNAGYQLMLKQGWKTRGLGPSEDGRLYPLKTVLRKPRSGLGTDQDQVERVTHFKANDLAAIRHRNPEHSKSRREMSREYETDKRRERRLRKALS